MDKTKPVEYDKKELKRFLAHWRDMPVDAARYEASMYGFIDRMSSISNTDDDALSLQQLTKVYSILTTINDESLESLSLEIFGDKETGTGILRDVDNTWKYGEKGTEFITRASQRLHDTDEMKGLNLLRTKLEKAYTVRKQANIVVLANAWRLAYLLQTYTLSEISQNSLDKIDDANNQEYIPLLMLTADETRMLNSLKGERLQPIRKNAGMIRAERRRSAAWHIALQLLSERMGTTAPEMLATNYLEQDGVLSRVTREAALLFVQADEKKNVEAKTLLQNVQDIEQTTYDAPDNVVEAIRSSFKKSAPNELWNVFQNGYNQLADGLKEVKP